MKIICTKEEKEQLIKESRYLEYEVRDIDSDKANTLMHIYDAPDDFWIVVEESTYFMKYLLNGKNYEISNF
jgi:hypothetical protein